MRCTKKRAPTLDEHSDLCARDCYLLVAGKIYEAFGLRGLQEVGGTATIHTSDVERAHPGASWTVLSKDFEPVHWPEIGPMVECPVCHGCGECCSGNLCSRCDAQGEVPGVEDA